MDYPAILLGGLIAVRFFNGSLDLLEAVVRSEVLDGHGNGLRKTCNAARGLSLFKVTLKDGDRVSGVIAESKDGSKVQVDAKVVIVASAGFNEDREMIKKYSQYGFDLDPSWHGGGDGDIFFITPNLKQTGDGQKMAWEAGADKGSMGTGLVPQTPRLGIAGVPPWITFSQLTTILDQPYLWVNQQGERYYD